MPYTRPFCFSRLFRVVTRDARPMPGTPSPRSDWWHSCALAFVLRERDSSVSDSTELDLSGGGVFNYPNICSITSSNRYLAA